jgi:hypothetical protein
MVAQLLVSVTSFFDTKPFYFHPAEWFGLGIFSTLPLWHRLAQMVFQLYIVIWLPGTFSTLPWQNAMK